MSVNRASLALWLSAVGPLGFLLEYESHHARDIYWWVGAFVVNLLLVASIATSRMKRGKTFAIRTLIQFQFIAATEAFAIRWVGTVGVLAAAIAAGLSASLPMRSKKVTAPA